VSTTDTSSRHAHGLSQIQPSVTDHEHRIKALEAAVAALTPPPVIVPVPPPVVPPPAAFPWPSLQAAVSDPNLPAGSVIDATGRTFNELVTIQKPLTIKGGTIDGQNTRQQWIRIWAPDVTLDSMSFKNAAAGALQTGSIDVSDARARLIALWAVGGSYAVLRLWSGSINALVQGCDFSGAPMGVIGWESFNSIVRGGRFHHATGTPNPGNENGGIKIGKSPGFLIDGTELDHNVGLGGWYDVSCSGASFANVLAHDNVECGLMVEMQDGFSIKNSKVYRNAVGHAGNGYERNGGIFISSDENGEVSGNTVAWNGPGTTAPPAADITIVSQPTVHPETAPHGGIKVFNNILRKAPVAYGYTTGGTTFPVLNPNSIVPDTDPSIAGLK
jgi:hypothetical protein